MRSNSINHQDEKRNTFHETDSHEELAHDPVIKTVLLSAKYLVHELVHQIPKDWNWAVRYYLDYKISLPFVIGPSFYLNVIDETNAGSNYPYYNAAIKTAINFTVDKFYFVYPPAGLTIKACEILEHPLKSCQKYLEISENLLDEIQQTTKDKSLWVKSLVSLGTSEEARDLRTANATYYVIEAIGSASLNFRNWLIDKASRPSTVVTHPHSRNNLNKFIPFIPEIGDISSPTLDLPLRVSPYLELDKYEKKEREVIPSRFNIHLIPSYHQDALMRETASVEQIAVKEERIQEVTRFHVSPYSKPISDNENVIGMVIYDYEGSREFDLNGKKIIEGYIYFKSPEYLDEIDDSITTKHGKLFKSLFNVNWDDVKEKMTVSGFARSNGKWKGNSSTFNENYGPNYTSGDISSRTMSEYELKRVIQAINEYLNQASPKVIQLNTVNKDFKIISAVLKEQSPVFVKQAEMIASSDWILINTLSTEGNNHRIKNSKLFDLSQTDINANFVVGGTIQVYNNPVLNTLPPYPILIHDNSGLIIWNSSTSQSPWQYYQNAMHCDFTRYVYLPCHNERSFYCPSSDTSPILPDTKINSDLHKSAALALPQHEIETNVIEKNPVTDSKVTEDSCHFETVKSTLRNSLTALINQMSPKLGELKFDFGINNGMLNAGIVFINNSSNIDIGFGLAFSESIPSEFLDRLSGSYSVNGPGFEHAGGWCKYSLESKGGNPNKFTVYAGFTHTALNGEYRKYGYVKNRFSKSNSKPLHLKYYSIAHEKNQKLIAGTVHSIIKPYVDQALLWDKQYFIHSCNEAIAENNYPKAEAWCDKFQKQWPGLDLQAYKNSLSSAKREYQFQQDCQALRDACTKALDVDDYQAAGDLCNQFEMKWPQENLSALGDELSSARAQFDKIKAHADIDQLSLDELAQRAMVESDPDTYEYIQVTRKRKILSSSLQERLTHENKEESTQQNTLAEGTKIFEDDVANTTIAIVDSKLNNKYNQLIINFFWIQSAQLAMHPVCYFLNKAMSRLAPQAQWIGSPLKETINASLQLAAHHYDCQKTIADLETLTAARLYGNYGRYTLYSTHILLPALALLSTNRPKVTTIFNGMIHCVLPCVNLLLTISDVVGDPITGLSTLLLIAPSQLLNVPEINSYFNAPDINDQFAYTRFLLGNLLVALNQHDKFKYAMQGLSFYVNYSDTAKVWARWIYDNFDYAMQGLISYANYSDTVNVWARWIVDLSKNQTEFICNSYHLLKEEIAIKRENVLVRLQQHDINLSKIPNVISPFNLLRTIQLLNLVHATYQTMKNTPQKWDLYKLEVRKMQIKALYFKHLSNTMEYGDTPKDGNCLFHAISYYCGIEHGKLRRLAVEYQQNNRQEFIDKNLILAHEYDDYIQSMAQENTWATLAEIYALSQVFKRPIIVVLPDHNMPFDNLLIHLPGEPIFLKLENNHYGALLLRGEPYFERDYSKYLVMQERQLPQLPIHTNVRFEQQYNNEKQQLEQSYNTIQIKTQECQQALHRIATLEDQTSHILQHSLNKRGVLLQAINNRLNFFNNSQVLVSKSIGGIEFVDDTGLTANEELMLAKSISTLTI